VLTGHLYFIYKILHVIKIADELNESTDAAYFVPVYYMGSEDADLNELGRVFINGVCYQWKTDQQGAVGRMKIDEAFIDFLNEIRPEILKEPEGESVMSLLASCYQLGKTIQEATLELVNQLFGKFGLLILIPDNSLLKNSFKNIMEEELKSQSSYQILQNTLASFPSKYDTPAKGRLINLFYLKGNIRERIEKNDQVFKIVNTGLEFSEEEILKELHQYPEHFSPNVILRPLFQEMLLPNVVFVGGGAELGYWMELKNIFESYSIPYPLILLRNSFTIIEKSVAQKIEDLKLEPIELFQENHQMIDKMIEMQKIPGLFLASQKEELIQVYQKIEALAKASDVTLEKHVAALKSKALKKIEQLEKKMLRAERKRFQKELHFIINIKSDLFPNDALQERVDNFCFYAARYGLGFIDSLYSSSKTFDQLYCILVEE
jgi:bacillithiol biosynthesis cysteine-adding enzyme BshC